MIFPKLNPGQFFLIFSEVSTGKILTINGKRYINTGEYYVVFESRAEAEKYAREYVARSPAIECSIHGSDGTHLEFIRAAGINGPRP